MSQRTCAVPRPLPTTLLDQIARQVAEAHAGTIHATLVRVRPGPAGVEIGLCSLPEGVHPADALLGHVVPPTWAASGVIAPAWARPIEEAAATGTGTRTTVVMLVGRDGHVASHAIGLDGFAAGTGPPAGRIPDLLLRTLGLPTPPLQVSAAEWWRACWLDALVASAAADPGSGPDHDRPLTSTLPPTLVEALVDEPELCTDEGWARIRRLAALPHEPDDPGAAAVRATVSPHIGPDTAAWMDDGCFGRWLLDVLPSVDQLLEAAAALVSPELLDLLREVAHGRDSPAADPPTTGEPAPQRARGGTDGPR